MSTAGPDCCADTSCFFGDDPVQFRACSEGGGLDEGQPGCEYGDCIYNYVGPGEFGCGPMNGYEYYDNDCF